MKTMMMLVAGLAVASVSSAGDPPIYRGTLDTPFFPGNGNDNVNFAIQRTTEAGGAFDGNTVELGLKAKERFFGDGNVGGTDEVYIVQEGFSPTSGAPGAPLSTNAWWNFDLSVDLGSRDFTNTGVTLTISDIEGDVLPIPFTPFPGVLEPMDSLFQDSQNIAFSGIALFLGGYDAFAQGDYNFSLAASDLNSGASLGQIDIIVRVVPSAPTAALLGLGGLAAVRRRR